MGRNFFGRVEVCFPVLDPALKQRVIDEGLALYLECDAQAWLMDQNGEYRLAAPDARHAGGAQQRLLKLLASH